MHPTTTENKVVSPPSAEAPKQPLTLEERLEKIESGVTDIHEKVFADDLKKKQEKQKASRATITIAFAFVFLKIFGLIGSQIGLLKGAVDAVKDTSPQAVKDTYEAQTKNLTGDSLIRKSVHFLVDLVLHSNSMATKLFAGGTIGGLFGAIVGGVIGWTRGDRIKDPYDLVKRPVESMKKIFGPAPKNHKPLDVVEEQHEKKIPNPSSHILPEKPKESPLTAHQPAAASKPWAHRMEDKHQELQEPALFPNR